MNDLDGFNERAGEYVKSLGSTTQEKAPICKKKWFGAKDCSCKDCIVEGKL